MLQVVLPGSNTSWIITNATQLDIWYFKTFFFSKTKPITSWHCECTSALCLQKTKQNELFYGNTIVYYGGEGVLPTDRPSDVHIDCVRNYSRNARSHRFIFTIWDFSDSTFRHFNSIIEIQYKCPSLSDTTPVIGTCRLWSEPANDSYKPAFRR